jgi:hypothetical protein
MAEFQSGQPSRALQAWQILICAAHHRQTITYGMLSEIVGFEGAGVWNAILDHVALYCHQNGLPVLTVLVVNQESGEPGGGVRVHPQDISRERERVFNYRWFRWHPPTEQELAQAFQRGVQAGGAAGAAE